MNQFSELFREVSVYYSKMSSSQKITLGMFVLTIAIIIVSVTSSAFSKDSEVLFSNLENEEASKILEKLESYGINKEYKNGIIYVDKGTRDNIHMRLTIDKALPDKKSWSLLQNVLTPDSWTTTSESKKQKELYAMESDLSKLIGSMDKLSSAQVIFSRDPRKSTLYSADSEKRTAAVHIKIKTGQKLNLEEAEGIATVVSYSSALPIEMVKVVDQKGKVYQIGTNEDGGTGGKVEKWELTKKIESDYIEKIKNVLNAYNRKSIDDIKVVVSLKLNMDKVVKKSDRINPDETVVFHKFSKDLASTSKTTKGVVGADPNAAADANKENSGTDENTVETTKDIKVEASREITETIKNPGSVESISVAVTLPYKMGKDAAGVESEMPLDDKAINDAKELVLTAVGEPLKLEKIVIKSVPYKATFAEGEVIPKKWFEHISDNIPPWFSPFKALLTIILIFVLMRLISVTKKSYKASEAEDEHGLDLVNNNVPDTSEEDAKIKELEENLSKAINEDLKKAASIVKRWAVSG